MTEIDARKMSCPAPVLMTREAVESRQPEMIQVLVDNDAACRNVSRFLQSESYAVTVTARGTEFMVNATREARQDADPRRQINREKDPSAQQKIMVMLATDRIGSGDDRLGRKLMLNFIKTLKEMGPDLWRLVMVNNGVKLAVSGSEALDDLSTLEKSGVTILVCGTCLDHFNLLDAKKVGETTNMLDIVTSMQLAEKVINI